jgi:hypothetical protein
LDFAFAINDIRRRALCVFCVCCLKPQKTKGEFIKAPFGVNPRVADFEAPGRNQLFQSHPHKPWDRKALTRAAVTGMKPASMNGSS